MMMRYGALDARLDKSMSVPLYRSLFFKSDRIVAVLIILIITSVEAQDKKYYFYHSLPYGSESTFNPISLIVNGGFDELQAYEYSHSLSQIPWKNGGRNVWLNITAPLPQINKYGWNRFIENEIIPTSLNTEHAQYFPNYTLHLIGGGMTYRKIFEWYDAHGYPLPRILGALTTMSYHYINEIIENGDSKVFCSNVDPIADLLVFDPLGIILFNFDGIAEFFSEKLSLNDWSMQPAVTLYPLTFRNIGQNFVMKYPITSSGKTSLMYHFGIFGTLGLSFKTNDEEAISFGVGVMSKRVYTVDTRNGSVTKSIVVGPIAGVYWDRNNSLLASFVASDSFYEIVRLNIYPGIIKIFSVSPGIFASVGERGKCTFGMSLSVLPLGICGHYPR
jgi:hypothetical protein